MNNPAGNPSSLAPGDRDNFEASRSESSLVKVRDILFGLQFQDFEARLDELQERLDRDVRDTKALYEARLESMEALVTSQFHSLRQEMREFLEESVRLLDGRIREVDRRLDEERGDWNQRVEERFLDLAFRVHELDEKFQSFLHHDMKSGSGYPRNKLARLLSEAAVRLDSHYPEPPRNSKPPSIS